MRVIGFYHSLVSDWNHGNAHFLRGIATELMELGHQVRIYEPADGWSRRNLVDDHGPGALEGFQRAYPNLRSRFYEPETIDLEHVLSGADLVLVHEWSDPVLVRRIGQHRRRNHYVLLFHDTHHRAITAPEQMRGYDLSEFDGVLAYGEALREVYLKRSWTRQVWTWHEAADTRVFRPIPGETKTTDLVWIGNWGDEERSAELREYLLNPARELGLTGRVYGVRYPEHALAELAASGFEYGGWLPNYEAPAEFARARVTVHVPRRPYVQSLRGIPTIRPFEAMACGIPLVSSPWEDSERLFTEGRDFLMARSGAQQREHLRAILHEPELARSLVEHARATILSRHTCAHRVNELLAIYEQVAGKPGVAKSRDAAHPGACATMEYF